MIRLTLKQSSVDSVEAYMERVRQRIFANVRAGMQQAMEQLAGTVAEKLHGDPIVSRTGELEAAVLASPKVRETALVIQGRVSADIGQKHFGIWFEEGTHVPAVPGHLYGFTEPDGETFFTRGHRAFDVKPHPILNPSLREDKPAILQIIADRISAAIDGTAS